MIADADSPPLTSRRLLVRVGDGAIAVAFLVAMLVEIWDKVDLSPSTSQQVLWTVMAPVVSGPIIFRSVRPVPAFAVNAVGTIVLVGLGYQGDVYQWANLLLLYSASLAARQREALLALAAGFAGVVYFFATFRDEDRTVGVMVLALWFVVWMLGRMQQAKQMELRLRADRDVAAELAATRATRLELEAQRTTMARELHDLIGHTVNVMVVHAGAGRRAVANDPAAAEQAFATIESTGRSALDELDRVLGILRSDDLDVPLAPLPDLTALPSLAEEFRGAGLPTDITTTGPVETLPGGIGLSIYRVVQEGLTNTLKHGRATGAAVAVSVKDERVLVEIVDDGVGGPTATTGSGRGLAGIAERVQLHGGTVRFESDDGYRVTCEIPLTLAVTPTPAPTTGSTT